jgi:hypothetical protein
MSKKNARILGLRLDQEDTDRLERFEKETTLEGVSLARAALKAALSYYEQNGEISLPLHISPIGSKPSAPSVKAGPKATPKITPIQAHRDAFSDSTLTVDKLFPSGKKKRHA